jgi:hypothetical protein
MISQGGACAEEDRSGDATTAIVLSDMGDKMGQWLIADFSFLEVHFQAWMVAVTGILLLWFLYARRQARRR